MNNSQKKILLAFLCFAFFIRFYKVDQIPNGLYYDEIDSGYQARSLIQTGKDYRGTLSPFFVNSNVEERTPIPIYFTALSTLTFRTPELQVRMADVMLGTINILLVFILIMQWRKNYLNAIITAFVFAANPWQIQFSRFNHEANSAVFMVLLALIIFFNSLKKKSFYWLLLSVLVLSLGMYTYRTMSLFVPVLFLTLFLIYSSKLKIFGHKKLIIAALVFLIITLPFLETTTFGSADTPRIKQISVFSDPELPILIQRSREFDSGDLANSTIGKKAVLQSYFFHNKPLGYLGNFFRNYFESFSVDFLFLKGDPNHRHSIPNFGMLLRIDILALALGLLYLFQNIRRLENKLVLSLFFLSPVPSSLTIDGNFHAGRLFIFSLPLLIIVSMGWIKFYDYFKKVRFFPVFLSLLIFVWGIMFIFYLHGYFVHYKTDSARYFSYGFKEAITKIKEIEPEYKKIILTQSIDPPMFHYFFWANISPKEVQSYGSQFGEDIIKNMPLDKIKVTDSLPRGSTEKLIQALKPGYLYLLTQSELPFDLRFGKKPPEGIKVLDVITYPDGQVDLYLISKDGEFHI